MRTSLRPTTSFQESPTDGSDRRLRQKGSLRDYSSGPANADLKDLTTSGPRVSIERFYATYPH
jgi:hypothetical protein